MNHQNKLALWAGQISECRNSGQNAKVWCKANNADLRDPEAVQCLLP